MVWNTLFLLKKRTFYHLVIGPRFTSASSAAFSRSIRSSSIRNLSTRSRVSSVWYGVDVNNVDAPGDNNATQSLSTRRSNLSFRGSWRQDDRESTSCWSQKTFNSKWFSTAAEETTTAPINLRRQTAKNDIMKLHIRSFWNAYFFWMLLRNVQFAMLLASKTATLLVWSG